MMDKGDKIFLGGVVLVIIIFLVVGFLINDKPDYKALYEEQEYQRELDRQFQNGTIQGANAMTSFILNQAICPSKEIQIPLQDNQVVTLKLEECFG